MHAVLLLWIALVLLNEKQHFKCFLHSVNSNKVCRKCIFMPTTASEEQKNIKIEKKLPHMRTYMKKKV